jgi:hypothetical protein
MSNGQIVFFGDKYGTSCFNFSLNMGVLESSEHFRLNYFTVFSYSSLTDKKWSELLSKCFGEGAKLASIS